MASSPAAFSPSHRFGRITTQAYFPTRRSEDAQGYDLRSAYDVLIHPGDWDIILTDLWVFLPAGCVGIISPCTDWSREDALNVQTCIVDAQHTSNLGVKIFNYDVNLLEIPRGARIGQITFHPVLQYNPICGR